MRRRGHPSEGLRGTERQSAVRAKLRALAYATGVNQTRLIELGLEALLRNLTPADRRAYESALAVHAGWGEGEP